LITFAIFSKIISLISQKGLKQKQKIICYVFFLFQGNPYAMKDGASGAEMAAWSSAAALQPTAGYYSYDHPTLAAYG